MYHCSSSQAVGAVAERVADHGVGGADDAGGENQPVADVAEFLIEQVDRRAQCQQRAHHGLRGRALRAPNVYEHRYATVRKTRGAAPCEVTAHLQARWQRSSPMSASTVLGCLGGAAALVRPSRREAGRTISARATRVNRKTGKLTRG